MKRKRAVVLVGGIWIFASVAAGIRIHRGGGVFGEAVGPGAAIGAQLVLSAPWALAGVIAWWAAGRWPITRSEILRPVTIHAWIGMLVVTAQQVLTTLLSTLLPLGLRPLDPWARLPEYLTYRGPVALAVYLAITASCLALRGEAPRDQDAPGAGSDESP